MIRRYGVGLALQPSISSMSPCTSFERPQLADERLVGLDDLAQQCNQVGDPGQWRGELVEIARSAAARISSSTSSSELAKLDVFAVERRDDRRLQAAAHRRITSSPARSAAMIVSTRSTLMGSEAISFSSCTDISTAAAACCSNRG